MAINAGPDIVEDGLVLCLDAANINSYPKSGTTWSDLAGSNNGTLTNGPTFDAGNGGGIVFDGTNDYVSLGAVQVNTAAGTIGMHVKLNSTTGRFFGRGNYFETRFSSSNLVLDFTGNNLTSSRTVWSGDWLYLVVAWDENANSTALYVNGVADSTGTCGSVSTQTGNMNIGQSWNNQYINGKITDFHSYNRVLTLAEIKQNYEATIGRYS